MQNINQYTVKVETCHPNSLSEVEDKSVYKIPNPLNSFYINPLNEKERWRANNFLLKEPETIEWLKSEITDQSVFWDIGANIGLYSLYAATLNQMCRILAFEPESQNFASLCRNVYVNKFSNIDVFGFAINGASLSIGNLHVSEMVAGAAVHNLEFPSPWTDLESVFQQKTITVSLDDLVDRFLLPLPTIVKIDVDGIELEILNGSMKMLHSSINSLLVELDACDNDQIDLMTEIMTGAKFSLVSQSNRSAKINGKLPKNYIWKK